MPESNKYFSVTPLTLTPQLRTIVVKSPRTQFNHYYTGGMYEADTSSFEVRRRPAEATPQETWPVRKAGQSKEGAIEATEDRTRDECRSRTRWAFVSLIDHHKSMYDSKARRSSRLLFSMGMSVRSYTLLLAQQTRRASLLNKDRLHPGEGPA